MPKILLRQSTNYIENTKLDIFDIYRFKNKKRVRKKE